MAVAREARELGLAGSPLPLMPGLPTNCPGCGVGLDPDQLRRQVYVCDCGHHFPIHADAWIQLLADAGTAIRRQHRPQTEKCARWVAIIRFG